MVAPLRMNRNIMEMKKRTNSLILIKGVISALIGIALVILTFFIRPDIFLPKFWREILMGLVNLFILGLGLAGLIAITVGIFVIFGSIQEIRKATKQQASGPH